MPPWNYTILTAAAIQLTFLITVVTGCSRGKRPAKIGLPPTATNNNKVFAYPKKAKVERSIRVNVHGGYSAEDFKGPSPSRDDTVDAPTQTVQEVHAQTFELTQTTVEDKNQGSVKTKLLSEGKKKSSKTPNKRPPDDTTIANTSQMTTDGPRTPSRDGQTMTKTIADSRVVSESTMVTEKVREQSTLVAHTQDECESTERSASVIQRKTTMDADPTQNSQTMRGRKAKAKAKAKR
ncbi:hypothetical protein QR680_011432 [Steinernema hermaphroditum]|uniref:Uncharacterized protein n=1 Tax=Steinernema hermaphroditum TaxID=289476 RepID=A0AA39HYK0_9BILA|nr:hypothetical protein QR680_011432 [Steinernema hermaphroditum]